MWEFNCPKFRDFSQPLALEDSTSDDYFDVDHDGSDIYFDTLDKTSVTESADERPVTRSMTAAVKAVPSSESHPDAVCHKAAEHHSTLSNKPDVNEDNKENLSVDNSQVTKVIPVPKKKKKPVKLAISVAKASHNQRCAQAASKGIVAPSNHQPAAKKCPRGTPYKSLAQFVDEFHHKTPLRYRTLSTKSNEGPKIDAVPLRRTVPVTPHLVTRLRAYHHELHNKQDKIERSKGSKAEVPRAVQQSKQGGSSNAKKALVSTMVAPHKVQGATSKGGAHKSLRSSSVPKRVVSGLPACRPRARSTTPEPFSFQERHREARRRKEEYVSQELKRSQEDMCTFRAHPLPDLKKSFRPKKEPASLTEVEPFRLLSEARHLASLKSLNEKERQRQKEEEEAKKFKAQTCDAIYLPPFEPKRTGKHTIPKDLTLHSDTRAEQRRLFDLKLEEEGKKKRAEAERLRKLKEEEEVREERKRRVHKARPAPKYTRNACRRK